MSEDIQNLLAELKIDRNNLYREEALTDLRVGRLQRMVPIKADGSEDTTRSPLFVGVAHLMTAQGPLPVSAEIEASTLEEAIDKFPDAIQKSVENMIDEAREMRRQEAGRIIVPGAETPKIFPGS